MVLLLLGMLNFIWKMNCMNTVLLFLTFSVPSIKPNESWLLPFSLYWNSTHEDHKWRPEDHKWCTQIENPSSKLYEMCHLCPPKAFFGVTVVSNHRVGSHLVFYSGTSYVGGFVSLLFYHLLFSSYLTSMVSGTTSKSQINICSPDWQFLLAQGRPLQ